MSTPKPKRGFAAMSPERLKEIARQGGIARKGQQWNQYKKPQVTSAMPPASVEENGKGVV